MGGAFILSNNWTAVLRCIAKWDVDVGVCELQLREHNLGVRALARLDPHAVISGSLDMTVRLLDQRMQTQ